MDIKIIKVGDLKCNCYILNIDNKVLVIDPGAEYEKIKKELVNKEVLGILLTHNHFDHVGCIFDIMRDYHTKLYDYNSLKEQSYAIGPFNFEVIFTPGHTPDCISIYFKEENIMFTGDFLFYDTIGRCDLPGSDFNEMKQSIEKIKKYNPSITVYPGHGIKTTLEREFNNNIYFK